MIMDMDVDVDECKDKRGIRRGACVSLHCACSGYRRPDDGKEGGMKCSNCLHPPGKHTNLDNPNATSSQETGAHSSKLQTVSLQWYMIIFLPSIL